MGSAYFLIAIYLFTQIPYSSYILLILILFLLFASAIISGSEVAFFSLTAQQLEECKQSKKSKSKTILFLLSKPEKLLATILILNNLINVAIVTLSTFTVWQFTQNKEEGWTVVLLTIVITGFIVFFGEITPKVFATKKNLFFARSTASVFLVFLWLFQPFSSMLVILNRLFAKEKKKNIYNISINELNKAVEMTAEESTQNEKEILKGIVNFSTKTVKQIMSSRIDIMAFDIKEKFSSIIEKINKSPFSRIPVYQNTIDSIRGILYIKDLLPFLSEKENFDWTSHIKRDVFFIADQKRIDELLKDFKAKRVHMAIVADEYGGTSGLVTMEDIIEEIVGEIHDEFDNDEIKFKQIDENTFFFEGKVSLNDFSKIVGIDPAIFEHAKGENESIGGLLLELFSKLPTSNQQIIFKNLTFTVMNVDKKRIKNIKVTLEKAIHNSDENIEK